MKTIKLRFRARLPDGSYFPQDNQYLQSFLRRASQEIAMQEGSAIVSGHESYLKNDLESYLEILIDGEWIPTSFK